MKERKELRFSDLKRIAMSPAHYLCALDRERSQQTTPQRIGEGTHALVLGGRDVLEYPKRRAGKEWEAFVIEHPGALILSTSEFRTAIGAANAIMRCADAVRLLKGDREQELPQWSILGRKCGGRPDVLGDGFVTEIKTGRTSHPSWFVRQAIRMGYHAQLSYYQCGAIANGIAIKDAFVVAVEQYAPYAVTPMQLTTRALEAGERLWRSWFERLIVCEDDDTFPAYTQSVEVFDVPELDDVEFTFGDEQPPEGEAA